MKTLQLFTPALLIVAGVAAAHAPVVKGAQDTGKTSWTVFAERAHTWTGEEVETLENVLIKVQNGKIAALTRGASPPAGDDVLRAAAVTAGMIDASVRMPTSLASVEQSSEVTPDKRVAEAIDVFDPVWGRQRRSGVTTVQVAPRDRNVVGGLTAVLKTGGRNSVEARTVRADVCVRGAIGGEPSASNHPVFRSPTDFYSRRPTTRMGVEWEWRKALYDAAAAVRLPERDYPGADVMRRVLAGELPLCIQAWTTQDIRTAVFLKEEMQREGLGEIRLIIDSAAEAWKEPQLLVRSNAQVVLPPFPSDGRTGSDNAFVSWNVGRVLIDAGVTIALSSHGARDDSQRLGPQAGYAMRGGLTFDEALAAVTINPARMLGVAERVGSLETGKDADVVLWSGQPFQPTSRVTGVLLDGALVLDPR